MLEIGTFKKWKGEGVGAMAIKIGSNAIDIHNISCNTLLCMPHNRYWVSYNYLLKKGCYS